MYKVVFPNKFVTLVRTPIQHRNLSESGNSFRYFS